MMEGFLWGFGLVLGGLAGLLAFICLLGLVIGLCNLMGLEIDW